VTDFVRWPSQPYRLSRNLGFNYVTSSVAAVVFAFAASLLLSVDLYLATDAATAHFKTSFDRWLPVGSMLFIVGMLYYMAFITFRSVPSRKALAQRGTTGRIINVDILYAEGAGRGGGVRYVYSYKLNDIVHTDSNNGLIAPLYLDGLQTRGAALVASGASQLLFSNLYPLQVSDAERAVVEADVANCVQRSRSGVGERLGILEAHLEGAARDYARLCGEIAAAAPGPQRDALIWKRHRVARRLPRSDLRKLLNVCREPDFATSASLLPSDIHGHRRIPIALLAAMIAASAAGGAFLFQAMYSGGQLSAGERGVDASFGPHDLISRHDSMRDPDPDTAMKNEILRNAIDAKRLLCLEIGGGNCPQHPADGSAR
jgi:hypothetical protein